MADEHYPHLFLPGPSDTRSDYRNPRRGGDDPRIKPQDRQPHAEHVRRALETAWHTAADRQAVAHLGRRGVYLEFLSEPGFDLILKSLESRQAGIKLLNVKKEGEEKNQLTRATVFVPHNKSAHFLKKATEYAEKDNPPKKDGTTTPKNAPLIESIGDVRAAILETSFWQDSPKRIPDEIADWVEAWLSTEDLGEIDSFVGLCHEKEIQVGDGRLTFPERSVLLIHANRRQLEDLIELSDNLAEFRAGREVTTFFIEEENKDQVAWVQDLFDRAEYQGEGKIAVLVLDHGVNNGHRLLEKLLHDDDCHAVDAYWGTQDDHGHGTLMAGTVAYGDLLDKVAGTGPCIVNHVVESSKILPPPPEINPKRLWAHYTAQGISLAEIQAPDRKRIICMAVNSDDEPSRGRPTSWSGQIDELASGYNSETRRLIILSAGNVEDPADWKVFPDRNLICEVQDPAQSWNALTVGAFTNMTRITDPTLASYQPIAEAGNLSPLSSTSYTWPNRKWPIKPEVLFEGGNIAKGPNESIFDTDDLKLISTYYKPHEAQFAAFNATSAASAQAAWMAARIQAAYPDAWPETVRALIVHSAEWTEAQKRSFLLGTSKTDYYHFARVCGYGVPNLERALTCAANSLSLISEATIQPFDKHETQSRYVTKDMHIYRLPWPVDVLRDLGEMTVRMRVTLSYYVEPSPGEVGWKDRYRYASHGLRFELNGPGEKETAFIQRINRKAREDDEHPGTEGAGDHWILGEARNVGSIHSDIWTGSAADLSLSNLIAIHPAVGWWRERHYLGKFNKQTRYSLIVSFTLPGQAVDIYTPVATRLGIHTVVEIPV